MDDTLDAKRVKAYEKAYNGFLKALQVYQSGLDTMLQEIRSLSDLTPHNQKVRRLDIRISVIRLAKLAKL